MSHPRQSSSTETMVKRFTAPTMRRALQMVREELGPEAVILSSQRTNKGVEVVTSLEPDFPTRGIDVRREFGRNFDADLDQPLSSDSAWRTQAGVEQAAMSYGARAEVNGSDRSPEELAREIERARERMLAARRRESDVEKPSAKARSVAQTYGGARAYREDRRDDVDQNRHSQNHNSQNHHDWDIGVHADDDQRLEALQSELADMRLLLEQQLWRMSNNTSQVNMPQQVSLPASYSVVEDHLARLGLCENLTNELLSSIPSQSRPSHAWRDCMSTLSRRVPVVKDDLIGKGGIFAFVGPTGVGKTTTIAKLAARFVLDNGAGKVAIVTTDTYRVGAHDQLRSLGRILGVPVRAVDKDHSLLTVLASLKQFRLILVDTAGFRQGDRLLKQQMAQLDACPAMKRVLVLAANSQLQSLKASTHAYNSRRGIDACVLTKLDESASLGEAISVVLQKSLPVAYTTDGQEIPKNISRASGRALVAKAVAMLKESINDARGMAAL